MRIISGKYGGRTLPGKIISGVRPTLDSVRETIFNILDNYISFNGIYVLDLFAGTGILGFESLSRGAEKCDFVDISIKPIRFIQNAAKELNIPAHCFQTYKSDAIRFLKSETAIDENEKYNLIFSDAPYRDKASHQVLELVSINELLLKEGIVVIEHSAKEIFELNPEFESLKSRKFGETVVDFFQYK